MGPLEGQAVVFKSALPFGGKEKKMCKATIQNGEVVRKLAEKKPKTPIVRDACWRPFFLLVEGRKKEDRGGTKRFYPQKEPAKGS